MLTTVGLDLGDKTIQAGFVDHRGEVVIVPGENAVPLADEPSLEPAAFSRRRRLLQQSSQVFVAVASATE